MKSCAVSSLLVGLGIGLGLLTGCINDPINSYTAAKYFERAEAAENSGNLMGARIAYSRASINSRLGHMTPEAQAHALYEWARVSGYLGYYSDSDKAFTEVIALIDKSGGKAESLRAPTWCEQARLLRTCGKDEQAMPVYAKAVAELEKQKVDESAPFAFAMFLADYAEALRLAKRSGEAEQISSRCAAIVGKVNSNGRGGAQNFRVAGRAAQQRNDWTAAKINWWRAVIDSEGSGARPNTLAVDSYEYGRCLGVVGEFAAAEIYLKKALRLDRENGGDVIYDLTELARLNYDQRKFGAAVTYFEEGLSLMDARNAEANAPAGLIEILAEYSDSLKQIAREGDAKKVDERIAAIRAKHTVLRTITERTPYGKNPPPQLPPAGS